MKLNLERGEHMPIVVNLFAGPGAGKSRTAAGIYFELKGMGVKATSRRNGGTQIGSRAWSR
jgi:hypothetical protein